MKINKVKLAKRILNCMSVIAALSSICGAFSIDVIVGFAFLGVLVIAGLLVWCFDVLTD